MNEVENREQFQSRWGFILACIGSAVGMANIWLFPIKLGKNGGAAFLIPYLICVALLGYTGVVEEMCFGRAMKAGPLEAFTKATKTRGSNIGSIIGWIPVFGSFGIAIGYTVVVGWILRFSFAAFSGSMLAAEDSGAFFGQIAGPMGSINWHIAAIVLSAVIMIAGVASGIEKVNKVMMPLFFIMFFILAIRSFTLEGASKGYEFLFIPDFELLTHPMTWVYALGQAFFSLSLAGSGTVIYGSYLSDTENAPSSAIYTSLFDTMAALLAGLVIIPAVFAYGIEPSAGPPLMFITMPVVFKQMPLGNIFSIIFFVAVLFAGITSLINLYETPVELLQQKFKLKRLPAVGIMLAIGFVCGLPLENGDSLGWWMDIISIYVIPLGALLAGVMFFWVLTKERVIQEVSKGMKGEVTELYYIVGKYVYCGVTLVVYILGIILGGIG